MKKTIKEIVLQKKSEKKITVLTVYDFAFAKILDSENIDILLVGDSLGMVMLGYTSTVPVTMRDMLHHTQAVSRGTSRSLIITDMPFGSYDTPERALRNAKRLMKQGGADGVKLEGAFQIEKSISALVQAGIPVMGHIGMTPQTASQLGGYKVQGKNPEQAEAILKEATLLEKLGVFSIVLECVPAALAQKITETVSCPTIGIGAGVHTDGQVLVLHDMLGFKGAVSPKFVRTFGSLEDSARQAVSEYREAVLKQKFPSAKESFS